ncbi:MAG: hypothetical protein KatS3mg077_2902 [Candidatus Binatia bacterium]|nr:MAG: hypothetical protein KatS3mg077_2902 [Candidatus Binatia bacterium]
MVSRGDMSVRVWRAIEVALEDAEKMRASNGTPLGGARSDPDPCRIQWEKWNNGAGWDGEDLVWITVEYDCGPEGPREWFSYLIYLRDFRIVQQAHSVLNSVE